MSNDGLFITSVDLGVQNVHLLSGEDIIGHVWRNPQERTLRVENPVMPNVAPDQSGNYRVGLLPLRPYLEKTKIVDVPEDRVLYHVPVGDRMERLYQQYTSGLIVPTGSLDQILAGK